MKWFKHISRAHRDTKIKRLINEFGADAYAIYFYCLELIADSLDADNVSFELEDDAELIGQYLKIDTLRVERIMKKFIDYELFSINEAGKILCFKMAKFLDANYTRSEQLKKMIKGKEMKSIKKSLDSQKTVLRLSVAEENIIDNNIIKDNIINNNIKDIKKKYLDKVFLYDNEYDKLLTQYGKEITETYIKRLNNYICSKGVRYKSHYHTILNWVDKEKPSGAPKPEVAVTKEEQIAKFGLCEN